MVKGLRMFKMKDGFYKFGTVVQETPKFYTILAHKCKNGRVFSTYNTCLYRDDISMVMLDEKANNSLIKEKEEA